LSNVCQNLAVTYAVFHFQAYAVFAKKLLKIFYSWCSMGLQMKTKLKAKCFNNLILFADSSTAIVGANVSTGPKA
jgi:hypothetical protein